MRCCVCGWADADDDHERAHLRSQYDYLVTERARLRDLVRRLEAELAECRNAQREDGS